ncbi:MAG: glycoside hydrolase, partial [Chloroflexota bacterium]
MTDFPPNPVEKAGYRLEFNDAFDTGQLDTNKWFPYYLPHWSSREQSAANYTFEDNCLLLYITQGQQPSCPAVDTVRSSTLQTGTFSGEVGSA